MISASTINFALALIIALFIINGLMQGLIHMVGSIVGLVIGVAVASRFNGVVGDWIAKSTGWNPGITTILAFILVLIVFTRVFGWLISMTERTFKVLKLPLVGLVNRIGGGALGFIEGVLILGASLILVRQLPLTSFVTSLNGSSIALGLVAAAKVLLPLLPKTVRDLYSPTK
jgi:uncharacterized membrane protein required for colicin V production